jgi:hypothetical protein
MAAVPPVPVQRRTQKTEVRSQKSEGSVTGHYKAKIMDIGTACKLQREEEAF